MRGTGSKFAYILAGVFLLVFIFSGSNIRTIFKLKSQIDHYSEKLDKIHAENKRLQEQIRLVKTEEKHLEYLARKKLGLIKEDEKKYYIIKQTESETSFK